MPDTAANAMPARTGAHAAPRPATVADAAELVRLRRVMFESMHVDVSDPTWEHNCRAWFETTIGRPWFLAFVVDAPDDPGLLAGTAVAEVMDRIPRPVNPSGRTAYISSVSTDPRWQRRGIGRALTETLLDAIRDQGVTCFELHATPMGDPLYRSFGFGPREGATERRLIEH